MKDQSLQDARSMDWLKWLASLTLMLATAAAVVLIAVGTIRDSQLLNKWGALLSIGAVVWGVIPVLLAMFVASVWAVEQARRLVGRPAPKRAPRLVIDPIPVAQAKVAFPTLSEEEILKILMELDAESRRGQASLPFTGSTEPAVGSRPAPAAAGDVSPNWRANPAGYPFVRLSDDLYALRIAESPNWLAPDGELEQACIAFLTDPQDQLRRLVVDGLKLAGAVMDSFCDCLFRLIQRFKESALQALRVVVSQHDTEMLDYLWRCVKRNTPGLDTQTRAAIHGMMLGLCFGPLMKSDAA